MRGVEKIDGKTTAKALAVQLAGVVVLGLATGLTLPHSAFVDWGWLIGPAAWMLAASVTARVVGLPLWPVLIGAVAAGLPSAAATALGAHWLGALLAIVVFAVWCGAVAVRRGLA